VWAPKFKPQCQKRKEEEEENRNIMKEMNLFTLFVCKELSQSNPLILLMCDKNKNRFIKIN
jgi:hypothetical protein